jgi:arginine decarboxylase
MDWDIDSARRRYNIAHWSGGYFDINAAGRLVARPGCTPGSPEVDLYELAGKVRDAGLSWPVLLRFTDILHHQVERLCTAFQRSMEAHGYEGAYTAVYPIKVNQQRHVVGAIVDHGGPRIGLEAGSKPELMAVLGVSQPGGIIICNGYKDSEYIRLALVATRLGQRTTIVIEKLSELELVLRVAAETGIRPRLGLRVRLATATAGNWQNTGGERSKFGFTAAGVLALLARLRETGMEDCLHLLHCHPGSQISGIDDFRRALGETACYYVELHGQGFTIDTVDVGGGLGVDYEGTASNSVFSVNYAIDDYARTVVSTFADICRQHDLPFPDLITESGRAMTAHHAVLVTNVIDTEHVLSAEASDGIEDMEPAPIAALHDGLRCFDGHNALQFYVDANERLAELRALYLAGDIGLEQRALGESLYYALCRKVQAALATTAQAHEVLDEINRKLADKYFCNLSVFQSMPDVWGIDQVFPIVPLHRHDEVPDRRAILHDLTCDSDGHIEHYVDSAGVESSLQVHGIRESEPYLLGIFLLGAYQEILGDMHNLFGDTDAVNVELTPAGGYRLVEPRHGDTVEELLRYVEFEPKQLMERYREKISQAELSDEERVSFLHLLEHGFEGYTYLEDE